MIQFSIKAFGVSLAGLVVWYIGLSITDPDYSQTLRDEWRVTVRSQFPLPEDVVVVKIEVTATALPPTSTPVPTSTPRPTPTPVVNDKQLAQMRGYMLELLNAERPGNPLAPNYNTSAQLYAEDLAERCSNSHTGLDGSSPEERYKRAGRGHYSWVSENILGWIGGNCTLRMVRQWTVFDMIDEAHEVLMASPGHRRNILHPSHDSVAFGFAVRDNRLWVVQVFVAE